jgi:hypothetical protein
VNATLSFLIKPLDDHGAEVLTLTPVINEIPLTVLLENFDSEHDMDPAGEFDTKFMERFLARRS